MKHPRLSLLVALPIVFSGCGGDGGTTAPTVPNAAATVEMRNVAFNPTTVSIGLRETVRWINRDTVDHQLGQLSGPQSGVIESGVIGHMTQGVVSIRFTVPGIYRYECRIHPTLMRGTVAVAERPPRDTTGGGGGY